MSRIVRAKFICHEAEKYPNGDDHNVRVKFSAVAHDEGVNKEWSKWTPSGELALTISNPNLIEHFVKGKEYYLNIVEAED